MLYNGSRERQSAGGTGGDPPSISCKILLRAAPDQSPNGPPDRTNCVQFGMLEERKRPVGAMSDTLDSNDGCTAAKETAMEPE